MGFKSRYLLFLLLPIAITLGFLSSRMKPWEGNLPISHWPQEITYPIQNLAHSISKNFSNLINSYLFLHNAALENQDLQKKIAKLEMKVLDYENIKDELNRIKSAIQYSTEIKQPNLIAEVIAHINIESIQTIRINKGYRQGIRAGMPILTSKGAVGKTLRTGLNHSDIHLLTDHNFYLDIIVDRIRVRGIIQGIGKNKMLLELHKRIDIKIGDSLSSSGLTSSFPKGIPVGIVTRIHYDSDEITQKIFVEPEVNLMSLEEVIIIKHLDLELETLTEVMGTKSLNHSVPQP